MKRYDFTYFLREGVRSIFLHSFMSFASVGIIVACLIIIGSFMLLAINVGDIITEAESSNEILAFIDDSLSDSEALSVGSKINAVRNVAKSEFVSRDKAFEDYSNELGDDSYLLEGLDSDSLLRHRYRIFLEDISIMDETVKTIEGIAGVSRVNASFEISDGILNLKRVVNVITYILTALLMGVSIFIISNTVRLTTFDRRDEIAIMKMVGATDSFIRWPFVCEGFILGAVAGFLAFLCQWGIYRLASDQIASQLALIQLVDFNSIKVPLLLAFLLTGFVVGVGGSVLAIRKFLRV